MNTVVTRLFNVVMGEVFNGSTRNIQWEIRKRVLHLHDIIDPTDQVCFRDQIGGEVEDQLEDA